ncbi:MAG: hypothetical protein SGPRY_001298 [Prymnesium sp.]
MRLDSSSPAAAREASIVAPVVPPLKQIASLSAPKPKPRASHATPPKPKPTPVHEASAIKSSASHSKTASVCAPPASFSETPSIPLTPFERPTARSTCPAVCPPPSIDSSSLFHPVEISASTCAAVGSASAENTGESSGACDSSDAKLTSAAEQADSKAAVEFDASTASQFLDGRRASLSTRGERESKVSSDLAFPRNVSAPVVPPLKQIASLSAHKPKPRPSNTTASKPKPAPSAKAIRSSASHSKPASSSIAPLIHPEAKLDASTPIEKSTAHPKEKPANLIPACSTQATRAQTTLLEGCSSTARRALWSDTGAAHPSRSSSHEVAERSGVVEAAAVTSLLLQSHKIDEEGWLQDRLLQERSLDWSEHNLSLDARELRARLDSAEKEASLIFADRNVSLDSAEIGTTLNSKEQKSSPDSAEKQASHDLLDPRRLVDSKEDPSIPVNEEPSVGSIVNLADSSFPSKSLLDDPSRLSVAATSSVGVGEGEVRKAFSMAKMCKSHASRRSATPPKGRPEGTPDRSGTPEVRRRGKAVRPRANSIVVYRDVGVISSHFVHESGGGPSLHTLDTLPLRKFEVASGMVPSFNEKEDLKHMMPFMAAGLMLDSQSKLPKGHANNFAFRMLFQKVPSTDDKELWRKKVDPSDALTRALLLAESKSPSPSPSSLCRCSTLGAMPASKSPEKKRRNSASAAIDVDHWKCEPMRLSFKEAGLGSMLINYGWENAECSLPRLHATNALSCML